MKKKYNNAEFLINAINRFIQDPKVSLPEEIFHFVSSITPLVCVDLLIRGEEGILLTWREDKFYGPGWHLPGGILRFKEKAYTRVLETSKKELCVSVKEMSKKPINIAEQINTKRDIRGHFIALLYECSIDKNPSEKKRFNPDNKINGSWKWHDSFPKDMINQHHIYEKFFKDF